MDGLSKRWRDDPVRATLERKANREAQAANRKDASEKMRELLTARLAAGAKAAASSMSMEDGGTGEEEEYKRALEKQRNRLMEEVSSASRLP